MMRLFMNTGSGNKEHKLCRHLMVVLAFFILPILLHTPLYSQDTAPAGDDIALQSMITSNFAGTFKTQIAKEGSDLQYIAKTFYGAQLGWPLVWYFNVESIPDPERIKAGTEIKIPRLKNGLDEKAAFQVLESAYILAYKRYLSLANRSDGQRRWVLLQATESGCDLAGDIWEGVLSESDLAWSEERGIKVVAKKTVPLVVAAEPILLADLVSAAAKSDETVMGQLAAKFEKAGKIDDVIADLETKTTAADAPPEVFLALSILYGRKGLRTKEYAALAAAETAATRPGVTFNVAVVYGRKQLLAGAPDADSFMVGSLELSSDPPGAVVFVDGARAGVTPLVVDKVKAGVRSIRLEAERYQSSETELAVDVGASIPAHYTLKGKPGSILVTTNPPGAYVWLDRETDYSHFAPTPAIFENIEPGVHKISTEEQFINAKELFLALDPIIVSVLPDEQTAIAPTLVRGEGTLRLTGFPQDSTVTLDDNRIDTNTVYQSGFQIEAGRYRLQINAPSEQKWTGYIVVKDETVIDRSANLFNVTLSRKTVKIDGITDDWTGLFPVWSREDHLDPFLTQKGTKMSEIYMCRDDKNLYWRVNFADGSPTSNFSKDIKQRLIYNMRIMSGGKEVIQLDINFDRGAGASTVAGLYNTATGKGTTLANNCISYKIGEGVLEAKIPLSVMGSRVSEGDIPVWFRIANADSQGLWIGEANSGAVGIDFGVMRANGKSFFAGRTFRNEVWIEGGSFRMGSDRGVIDEKPIHAVTLSPFWMMHTEVTQKDYFDLIGKNPSYFKGENLPVEQVSWYDAVAYANELSQKDGLAPAYEISGTKVTWNKKANGWRLPTEAEWEYAAIGGQKAQGLAENAVYAGSSDIYGVAWHNGNSEGTTHPVATKASNPQGLYDMSGNVLERCWDWYSESTYTGTDKKDPAGATSGSTRVDRGGFYGVGESQNRSSDRNSHTPDFIAGYVGFRLVRNQ